MAFIKASKYGIFLVVSVAILLLIGFFYISGPAQVAVADARTDAVQELPGGGSQLPLILFLGFGMLTGGLICAFRTRPEKQPAGS